MKAVVLAGMFVALVAAVTAFGAGLVLLGFIAVALGTALVAVAGRQARPSRWTPAEIEYERRSHHG